jgi:hypothetical protein
MIVILNQETKLKALFTDYNGLGVELDSISATITKPDETIVNAENIVEADEGFYTFLFNNTDLLGEYICNWAGQKDGQIILKQEKFSVIEGYKSIVNIPKIEKNNLVIITLEGLKSIEGEELETTYLSFTSEYDPYYCSVDMVRMQLGSFAEQVEDDLIALCIHLASKDAYNSTGRKINLEDNEHYKNARARLVTFDSCIRLMTMPLTIPDGSGDQKQLGDLMIAGGGSKIELERLLDELKFERNEWWRIVNSGGTIVHGQGLGPQSAVKGMRHKEAVNVSRVWHDPWTEGYFQPTVNSKYRKNGERKEKAGFTGFMGWSPWRQG